MIIDTNNPRDIKAIMLAASADTWGRLEQPGWFQIPSGTDPLKSYTVNEHMCSCLGNRSDRPCYHRKAVAFHLALVRAQREPVAPRQYAQCDARTAELSARYVDIFERFAN